MTSSPVRLLRDDGNDDKQTNCVLFSLKSSTNLLTNEIAVLSVLSLRRESGLFQGRQLLILCRFLGAAGDISEQMIISCTVSFGL